jgi:hypothetical protein
MHLAVTGSDSMTANAASSVRISVHRTKFAAQKVVTVALRIHSCCFGPSARTDVCFKEC